ncbi:2-amino-3-ketobutyrate coenzyme A ligase [Sesbania bispinosa]|nr:2-amino-3-ketobutyrate coenzyme A ligase [Sesbania bispinosa]
MSPASLSQKGEKFFFSSKKELANVHQKGKKSLEKRMRTAQHNVQADNEQGMAGRPTPDTAQQGQHMPDSAQCNNTTFTKMEGHPSCFKHSAIDIYQKGIVSLKVVQT